MTRTFLNNWKQKKGDLYSKLGFDETDFLIRLLFKIKYNRDYSTLFEHK